jgi:hypothetical protein
LAFWSFRSGITAEILRARSAARFALLEYALSAVTEFGRLRGRPTPPGRATATWSSNAISCRVSEA